MMAGGYRFAPAGEVPLNKCHFPAHRRLRTRDACCRPVMVMVMVLNSAYTGPLPGRAPECREK